MEKKPKSEVAANQPGEQISDDVGILDELLAASTGNESAPVQISQTILGECTDESHPVMTGRAKICVQYLDGVRREAWLATLLGVTVRKGDRVILQQPANYAEPVIMGVLDGLAPRRMAEKVPGPAVQLRQDEGLRVRTDEGKDLLEIYEGEKGPVIRLMSPDLDLEVPGRFRVRAANISLAAEEGTVEVEAAGDVVVKGEDISLN